MRTFFSLLLVLGYFASSASSQQRTTPQSSAQNAIETSAPTNQHIVAAKDYEQFVPYWTTEGSWDSELQIRNNLRISDLTVTPAIRAADGSEYPFNPIVIKPQEVQSVDINTTLQSVAPQLIGILWLSRSALSFEGIVESLCSRHGT